MKIRNIAMACHLQVHLNKLNVVEKFIYFSNSTQIVKLVYLATVVVRGVLPGLRRRRTGLLPSGPKSSFQMRASFVFRLETKVPESGGREEKLIARVA